MNIAQALEMKGETDSLSERQEAVWLLEHIMSISVLGLNLEPEQELTEIQQQTSGWAGQWLNRVRAIGFTISQVHNHSGRWI